MMVEVVVGGGGDGVTIVVAVVVMMLFNTFYMGPLLTSSTSNPLRWVTRITGAHVAHFFHETYRSYEGGGTRPEHPGACPLSTGLTLTLGPRITY